MLQPPLLTDMADCINSTHHPLSIHLSISVSTDLPTYPFIHHLSTDFLPGARDQGQSTESRVVKSGNKQVDKCGARN